MDLHRSDASSIRIETDSADLVRSCCVTAPDLENLGTTGLIQPFGRVLLLTSLGDLLGLKPAGVPSVMQIMLLSFGIFSTAVCYLLLLFGGNEAV